MRFFLKLLEKVVTYLNKPQDERTTFFNEISLFCNTDRIM